jgi:ubiquinone/menaquinone biosynthesis C-methylase UbiE
MEVHEKSKIKPMKPTKCAMCGDLNHSSLNCGKLPNFDSNFPANHLSASNYQWWLNCGTNTNNISGNNTEVKKSWALLTKGNIPQNNQANEDVYTWPGRRNICVVSPNKKTLFANEFFHSSNFRFHLSIILMRVFGIQTRPEATQIMNKFKSIKSDTKIIEEITNLFPEKKSSNADLKIQSDKSIVRDVLFSWKFHLNAFATKYLDIGCGIGTMSEALGLLLRLEEDCVYGIDVIAHESLQLKNFSVYDGVNIPFNDNEFDFLSIFQVLHHVELDKIDSLLQNVRRVCKNGGYLLLKEHNCDSDEFCQLIDIEHIFYSISRTSFCNPGLYKCKTGWKNLLATFGFQMIQEYGRKNEPTNSYFSLYICNK